MVNLKSKDVSVGSDCAPFKLVRHEVKVAGPNGAFVGSVRLTLVRSVWLSAACELASATLMSFVITHT